MNLVLLDNTELAADAAILPLADPRARHILDVLRRRPGDTLAVGVIDGPIGLANVHAIADGALTLRFTPSHEPPPLPPLALLIGLPRPQTARDLLREATTLGVAALHFVATEKADPNYATASLWTSGEWRRHLIAGAAQACDTRLPAVTHTHSLMSALALVCHQFGDKPERPSTRLALDNYEATTPLATALAGTATPRILAFGPERGWGPTDRAALRAADFTLCTLGSRVLRLETAVVCALALNQALPGPRGTGSTSAQYR